MYVKSWNGTAFAEQVYGDAHDAGIAGELGVVQSPALAVDPSGHPFVAWQDASTGQAQIDLLGNQVTIGTTYYVNDGSTIGDVFTTAIGAAGNTGLSPASPLASVAAVLSRYSLNPHDVILVDAGTYAGAITVPAADQGILIEGAPQTVSILNGLVTLDGTTGVVLQNLDLAGGVSGTNAANPGFFGDAIASLNAHRRFRGQSSRITTSPA